MIAVIPAFNESATIAQVVAGVRHHGLTPVVVDDGSTDDTATRALAAGAVVLRLPVNIGVGGALRTGFRYAVRCGARRVVLIDGDLQHDPADIPRLLAAADEGNQLVVGSRFATGEYRAPMLRRVAMRLLAGLVSRRVGVRLDDVTSGYRAVSEPLLSAFAAEYPAEYLGDTVESLLLAARHGASIAQVPVSMSFRAEGEATPSTAAAGHLLRILLVILVRPRRRLDP